MKTIRRSALIAFLALGAASCGTSSILAPDCEDPTACEYQPGSGNYQPGSGNYQPGSGNYQPGSGNYQPGSGNAGGGVG